MGWTYAPFTYVAKVQFGLHVDLPRNGAADYTRLCCLPDVPCLALVVKNMPGPAVN